LNSSGSIHLQNLNHRGDESINPVPDTPHGRPDASGRARVEDPSGIRWVRLRYRGLSQHQDFQVLPMLPTGRNNEFQATIPAEDIDPKFDLMYLFETMDNQGNGKIYPDLAKETPYIVVKIGK
jgi:hypothetical protein